MLIVTTAASDLNLLTLTELRAATGAKDNSKDAELTVLGARLSSSLAKYCKVAADGIAPPTLRQETLTETIRLSTPRRELILSRRPVVSITSITSDDETIDPADYEIQASAALVTRLSSDRRSFWPRGKHVVIYPAGWATVPDDLKLAASRFATILWAETSRDPSLKRVKIEGVSEREYWIGPTTDPLVPQEIADLMGDYVNDRIA